jgi:membrane protein YdbS with pleckstrin-like domain
MKNIIFNSYTQNITQKATEYVFGKFSVHFMNVILSKPVLFLSSLTLIFLCLSYYSISYLFVSFLLGLVTYGIYSICLFISSRDEFIFTNRGLVIRTGLFFIDVVEYSYKSIESIEISQNPIQTYFDFGDIYIRGNGGTTKKIVGVESPHLFRSEFQKYSSDDMGYYLPGAGLWEDYIKNKQDKQNFIDDEE